MSNNELISILSDYKSIVNMESELKKEKEKLANKIKAYMDSIEQSDFHISEYHVIYKEVIKTVVNTDLLKEKGLFDEYSKKQVSRPLQVK